MSQEWYSFYFFHNDGVIYSKYQKIYILILMLLIYVVERMGRTTKALTQCTGECCGGYQFK